MNIAKKLIHKTAIVSSVLAMPLPMVGVAVTGSIALSSTANAQIAVVDRTALFRHIETARNTLRQVEESRKIVTESRNIVNNLEGVTDLSGVAQDLANEAITKSLPRGIDRQIDLTSDTLEDLGSIGDRATNIISGRDFQVDDLSVYRQQIANASARDIAIAETRLDNADVISDGLANYERRLRTANTAKEVADLNASLAIQNARLQNEANRLSALRLAQEAERKLRQEEDYDRRKKANRDSRKNNVNALFGGGQ